MSVLEGLTKVKDDALNAVSSSYDNVILDVRYAIKPEEINEFEALKNQITSSGSNMVLSAKKLLNTESDLYKDPKMKKMLSDLMNKNMSDFNENLAVYSDKLTAVYKNVSENKLDHGGVGILPHLKEIESCIKASKAYQSEQAKSFENLQAVEAPPNQATKSI